MKKKKSIVDNRRDKIFQKLQHVGTVKVDELAIEMAVSELTIRRDLQYLEDMKLIERFYGGAMMVNNIVVRQDISQNKALCKHAIAKYAASLIDDGDIIFINTSSTALTLLDYLKDKRVTVVTNNGKAIFSRRDPLVSVILTGGELRTPKESMVGEIAIEQLKKITANKSFLGCCGLKAATGFTTAILQEVPINTLMNERCTGTRFLLCDHTKIGNESNFVSGNINENFHVITDTGADIDEIVKLRQKGVKTSIVKPLKRLD